MAIDVRKMKEDAAEFTRKGKFEDAIKIFKTLVLADKKEVQHAVKIAELYVKLKQNDKSIPWFETAAQKYAEQGHLPKAIAMAKLILQMDPQHAATQAMLSGLYAKKDVENPLLQKPQFITPAAKAAPAAAPAAKPAHAIELALEKEPLPTAPMPGFEVASVFAEEEDKLVSDAVDPDEEEERSFDLQNLGEGLADEADDDEITIEVSDDDLRAEITGVDSRLLEQLPRVPLFSDLNPEEFQRLIQHLDIRSYEPNEYILTEGDPGDSFFVITQGEAVVVKEDYAGLTVELAKLPEGSFFGEFGYLMDTHRTASVVAVSAVEVLEVARASFEILVQEHPRVKSALEQFYRERVLNTILAISPLFEPFSADEKQSIIERFEFSRVPADTVLIEEGTDGDGFYVILNGGVRVSKIDEEGATQELAELRAGEFFGEMSLLSHDKTTATVSTLQKTALFRLDGKQFAELVSVYPALLGVLRGFAVERRMRNQTLDAGFGESGLV